MILESKRIRLRQWQASDLNSFAELNADPHVMRYFPARLSREESDQLANRCKQLIEENTWGFWAVELKLSKQFIGMLGLHQPSSLPCSPCVEIGWRLHKTFWGKGYASEAARIALHYGFVELDLDEIVSFTTINNRPSRRLMERLGLSNTQQNFQHPNLNPTHALAEHVLYKITKDRWNNSKL